MQDEKINDSEIKNEKELSENIDDEKEEVETENEKSEHDEDHHEKRRGIFGSREARITKKELRELNKNLDESRERIKQLEKELAEKSAETKESNDKYIRLLAETDNFKKRMSREISDSIKYASEGLIIEMFPALNNFQMALLAAENVPETKNFAVGMEMILKQLMDVLKSKGLEEINPAGEEFDPYLHQAIISVPSESCEKEWITKVIRKGYKLHDKVLQPASVEVEVPKKIETPEIQELKGADESVSEIDKVSEEINNANKEKTD